MDALIKIRQSGFEVWPKENGNIGVKPFSRLTPEQLMYLKSHKTEILAQLRNQPSQKDRGLHAEDKAAILRWLHFIGENSQPIIDEVMEYCRTNPEGLAYYLKRSKEIADKAESHFMDY